MFLGCLYLGPLLFPLLLNAEIVTCFLFECFAVKLQSLLSHSACLQRSNVSCCIFHFTMSLDDTKKKKKYQQILKNCSGEAQHLSGLTSKAEINPRTAGPQQLLNRLSEQSLFFLLLRISWPFCFGNFSHPFFCFFFCHFPVILFLIHFWHFIVFIMLTVIY